MKKKMPRAKKLKWSSVFNYIVFPLLLTWFIYQPDFMHGFIDYFESGKELASVNELFHGKAIYKETLPYFGPLNMYLQAFAMILFGKNIAALNGYFYFGTLLTLLLGYFLGKSLCRGSFFPYLLAILLAVETISPFWGARWGGLRFAFGLLTVLCAVTFFKKRRGIWAFLTGACASISLLTSMDVGAFSFVSIAASGLLYVIALNFTKENKGQGLKSASLLAAGALSILVPFSVYSSAKGALVPYLETIFTIGRLHFKVWGGGGMKIALSEILNPAGLFAIKFKIILPLFVYIYAAVHVLNRVFRKKISWKLCAICCLSVYGALMYKVSFRAMLGPQFEMALQPAIILSFIFAEDFFYKMKDSAGSSRAQTRSVRSLKTYGLGLILVLFCVYALFSQKVSYGSFKDWCIYQFNKRDVVPVYLGFVPAEKLDMTGLTIDRAKGVKVPAFQVNELEGVTRHIAKMTDASEAVFTFPDLGLFNFLADRPCLDRFAIAAFAWTAPEWREELLADLERSKPRYVIRGRKLSNVAASIGMTEEVLPEVREYLDANYAIEASFDNIDILRRK